mmetsp:Transcript_23734/g.75979  ORF Transcript_23734/g.75979 Transcript_23734/m.75979 type:complete len:200 (+) Transcript_23734:356-955(+)
MSAATSASAPDRLNTPYWMPKANARLARVVSFLRATVYMPVESTASPKGERPRSAKVMVSLERPNASKPRETTDTLSALSAVARTPKASTSIAPRMPKTTSSHACMPSSEPASRSERPNSCEVLVLHGAKPEGPVRVQEIHKKDHVHLIRQLPQLLDERLCCCAFLVVDLGQLGLRGGGGDPQGHLASGGLEQRLAQER